MKLGSLKNDTRDGALVVVSKNLKHAVVAYEAAPTLQSALDDWGYIAAQRDSAAPLRRERDARVKWRLPAAKKRNEARHAQERHA